MRLALEIGLRVQRSHPQQRRQLVARGLVVLAIQRPLLAVPVLFISRVGVAVRPGFGLGLLVLRADETPLDPHRAIVIEDHERAAARDVGGIVGLPFRLQPLDFGLQLAEPRVHLVRQFLGRLVLLGQPVELGLNRLKRGLISAESSTGCG